MKFILIAMVMVFTTVTGSASEGYKYQVGKVGDLKMWVVDFPSTEGNSLVNAAWQWENQNPKEVLAMCKQEWLGGGTQNGRRVSSLRYSCQVFEK